MNVEKFLKLKKMREQVKKELGYVPRGSIDQNMCRQAYSALRLHGLGEKGQGIPKEKSFIDATHVIKKGSPDFCPTFEKGLFDIEKLQKYSEDIPSLRVCFIKKEKKD